MSYPSNQTDLVKVYKFVHQPGSGATTIAMNVLWKLREVFRCLRIEDFNLENLSDMAEKIIGDKPSLNHIRVFTNNFCLV